MARRPDIPALARLVAKVMAHPDIQQRVADSVTATLKQAQATAWDHGYATGLADTEGRGDQPNPYREPKPTGTGEQP